jgi:hypothetical protein
LVNVYDIKWQKSSEYDNIISTKKNELQKIKQQIQDNLNDRSKIEAEPVRRTEAFHPDCPRQCGSFGGGNRTCRNHCDRNYHQGIDRAIERRNQAIHRHNHNLETTQKNLEKELIVLQEKQKLPLLREQLRTATAEYRALSPNDPEYRQKQIDQKKSLYEKAVSLDTLERKHEMFGNLPPVRPEREIIQVTPDPITVYKEPEIIEKSITIGTAEFDYKKLAIAGAGIFAVLALIIWRMK